MTSSNSINAFFELLQTGLWSSEVKLGVFKDVDFEDVFRLAEEQSVVGLVLEGIERSRIQKSSFRVPQQLLLQWIGEVQIIEQQNEAMNEYVAVLFERLREEGVYALLVKGQGVAQCYDRPLWRSCGDIDLLLDQDNYAKAKAVLSPLASSIEPEGQYQKHLGMTIDSWLVELHGTLRTGLSARIDHAIDDIQALVHSQGQVRTWQNGDTQVYLPSPDNDVIFVFTHFLKHFYKEGLGLRQVCDWCRLLWTYRNSLNLELLESRIRKMGLMSEWKAFGMFAVDYLGMPAEAMPLYSPSRRWKRKAKGICKFVMEVGNMGHNRDRSHFDKPYLVRKVYSMGRRCGDLIRHARIFPLDSFRFFPSIMIQGVKSAVNGE